MSRPICKRCHYPIKTCVCNAVSKVNCQTKIYVMQHPSELKAAKNTVRLAQLCLPSIEVFIGEEPDDFKSIKNLPPENTFLLYPDDNAVNIETLAQKDKQQINLIILDGTWKKAYKLKMKNPWLTHFKTLSFANLPENQYIIRKSKRSDSLSSLEAMAYSLEVLENIDTQALYNVLNKMMTNFIKN
ncbi:hypothetical protein CJF42_10725 [Pseudoalteromonas sp. NBT06-2]|uniref:tRNA-uridine aminocarboxypropyltransferase n=1 Tax=Pseudoalteromonas sp. NBT06-2 TaxID=2025950 RepID=UPI000BA66DF3|nr:tRNA-uridine aminocarboxypropyltransferase [Pseudoalteromonas sp. NBT06-2]PAJ74369.1 hypothetical protein CJF42_10725 [Pseudoalteromonas sp. NBT06-2]